LTQNTKKAMRIYAKVIPRASQNKVEKISEGDYKIWLTAAPVDGEANNMLIRTLAKYFGVSKGSLKIIGGKTARKKIIEILE
jgi:uncharacterized protein YggU (UPF0235/DUF167 family)